MNRLYLCACLGLFACAAEIEPEDDLDVVSEALADAAPFTAKVSVSGDGCPANTWRLAVEADIYTLQFDQFFFTIEPGQATTKRSCKINADFASKQGIQFALGGFLFGTTADLDQAGMKLKQTTDYNFAGQKVKNVKHEILGPTPPGGIGGEDGGFFRDRIDPAPGDWTPCSKKDNVKINTDVVLKNNNANTGTGSSYTSILNFGVLWQTCQL